MELLRASRVPPIVAPPETTVFRAIEMMKEAGVGAVVVTDSSQKVLGIFTERDNMLRVTLSKRDPEKTKLLEVMTAPVTTASPEMDAEEALEKMVRSNYRHLPVVDKSQKILGVVSIRHLLMKKINEQESNLDTLSAYVTAGGPG